MSPRAHLLVALVSLGTIIFILRLVRRRQLRAKYSMLWLSAGLPIVILAAFPRLLDRVSLFLGVEYPPALLAMGGILFLFLVAVHFSWELSRLEERTRELAEEIALLTSDERR